MASKTTKKKTTSLHRSMAHRRVDLAAFLIQELEFVPPQPKTTDEIGFTEVIRKHRYTKFNIVTTNVAYKDAFPALSPSKKTKTHKSTKKSNRFEFE